MIYCGGHCGLLGCNKHKKIEFFRCCFKVIDVFSRCFCAEQYGGKRIW